MARVEKGQNIESNVRSGKEVGMEWATRQGWGHWDTQQKSQMGEEP